MKRIVTASLMSALVSIVVLTTQKAQADDNGSDTLSKDDIAAMVDERKDDIDDDARAASILEDTGIDIKNPQNTKVMNKDRVSKTAALERANELIKERSVKKYCDLKTPIKVKIDIAVVKNTPKGTSTPEVQVVRGFLDTCGNSLSRRPEQVLYQKLVQKIKVIHIKLAKVKPPDNFYDVKFDEQTGVATVGVRNYNVDNVSEKFEKWFSRQ